MTDPSLLASDDILPCQQDNGIVIVHQYSPHSKGKVTCFNRQSIWSKLCKSSGDHQCIQIYDDSVQPLVFMNTLLYNYLCLSTNVFNYTFVIFAQDITCKRGVKYKIHCDQDQSKVSNFVLNIPCQHIAICLHKSCHQYQDFNEQRTKNFTVNESTEEDKCLKILLFVYVLVCNTYGEKGSRSRYLTVSLHGKMIILGFNKCMWYIALPFHSVQKTTTRKMFKLTTTYGMRNSLVEILSPLEKLGYEKDCNHNSIDNGIAPLQWLITKELLLYVAVTHEHPHLPTMIGNFNNEETPPPWETLSMITHLTTTLLSMSFDTTTTFSFKNDSIYGSNATWDIKNVKEHPFKVEYMYNIFWSSIIKSIHYMTSSRRVQASLLFRSHIDSIATMNLKKKYFQQMVVPPGPYMIQDKSFSSFDPKIVTKNPFVPSLDKPPLIDSLIVNFSGNYPKAQHSNVNEDKEPKIPQDKHEQYFGESNTTHLHSLGIFQEPTT